MQIEKVIANFKEKSLLKFISTDLLELLYSQMKIVDFKAGLITFPNQDLYILISGECYSANRFNDHLVEELLPGRSVELGNFLMERKFQLNWFTKDGCQFLVINNEAIHLFFNQRKALKNYLLFLTHHPECYKLKRDFKLMQQDNNLLYYVIDKLKPFRLINDLNTTSSLNLILVKKGMIKVFASEKLIDSYTARDYLLFANSDDLSFEIDEHFVGFFGDLSTLQNQLDPSWIKLNPLKTKLKEWVDKNSISNEESEENIDDESEPEDDDLFEVKDFKPSAINLKKNQSKKFYWFQQQDMMDCGAACMAMIARFYGKKISLPTWRSLIFITREGASMLSVKKAAEKVGFDSIGVMTGYNSMLELQKPLIALMEYHYVVVYRMTEKSVTIGDPGSQLSTISKEEFLKSFSNNCLLLKPNNKLKDFPNSKNTFLKYLELFKGAKLRILEIILLSFIIFILGLAIPLFLQFVFDNVLGTLDKNYLRFIALSFIALSFISSFSEGIRSYLIAKLTSLIDSKLTALFMNHALRLPMSYYAMRNVGDITTRLEELEKIRTFFSTKIVITTINLFSIFIYTSILYLYSKYLPLILLPIIPIFLIVLYFLIKKFREILNHTFKAMGKNQSITFEQMNALETIQSIFGHLTSRWRLEETLVELLTLKKKFEATLNALVIYNNFFSEMIKIIFLGSAIYLYINNQLSLGQVIAINALSASIIAPLIALMQDWDEISKVGNSLERLDEIFTSKVEKSISQFHPSQEESLIAQGDMIKLNDVTFQYGNDQSPIVLNKINLEIPIGKTIALVGGSGSGKSTLGLMIGRIYDATKGSIIFGKKNILEIPLENLRSKVGIVTQDNALFSGTFIENIAFGDPRPNLEKVIHVATLANAHDFIMEKQGGYYFVLGNNGSGISGGQAQRINIARALYRNPDILILDEATSALDTFSESKIMEALSKANESSKTKIIIAHRLNTIKHADIIFVLDKGRLIEQGTHKQLMINNGKYYSLVRNQLGA